MIIKITDGVWKVLADSNVYYIEDLDLVIDTGRRENKHLLETFLSKVIPLDQVKKVIFTHLHYDHISNFDLFPNAKFYASKESIRFVDENKFGAILNEETCDRFNIDLNDIEEINFFEKYELLYTPGHTSGAICIYDKENQILYLGDTLLNTNHGRTDLPSGNEEQMKKTLLNLSKLNVKILCAGHEY